jgi:cytochrome c556
VSVRQLIRLSATALAILAVLQPVAAQHDHDPAHRHPMAAPAAASQPAGHAGHSGADSRQAVAFPAMMKEHTLANMRDHLLALAQIQQALAQGAPDQAAQIAEQRLGMTSLAAHGAHESSRLMPQGMQDSGMAMHRSASRFAIEAQNSAATGDLKPALAALAQTTQACVACHAGYRFQ